VTYITCDNVTINSNSQPAAVMYTDVQTQQQNLKPGATRVTRALHNSHMPVSIKPKFTLSILNS
jgi:hypothetical protein